MRFVDGLGMHPIGVLQTAPGGCAGCWVVNLQLDDGDVMRVSSADGQLSYRAPASPGGVHMSPEQCLARGGSPSALDRGCTGGLLSAVLVADYSEPTVCYVAPQEEPVEIIGSNCTTGEECEPPAAHAIRSDCPYAVRVPRGAVHGRLSPIGPRPLLHCPS